MSENNTTPKYIVFDDVVVREKKVSFDMQKNQVFYIQKRAKISFEDIVSDGSESGENAACAAEEGQGYSLDIQCAMGKPCISTKNELASESCNSCAAQTIEEQMAQLSLEGKTDGYEESHCFLEIVIETAENMVPDRKNKDKFNKIKEMFDSGTVVENSGANKTFEIKQVFPKIKDNPFVQRDNMNK
ncbi:hypothetical protein ENBRE01_1597 [Enteropsectra breve]|nr:hypothetical protein ENBRE01_1597 [Enteropsectra breve]